MGYSWKKNFLSSSSGMIINYSPTHLRKEIDIKIHKYRQISILPLPLRLTSL